MLKWVCSCSPLVDSYFSFNLHLIRCAFALPRLPKFTLTFKMIDWLSAYQYWPEIKYLYIPNEFSYDYTRLVLVNTSFLFTGIWHSSICQQRCSRWSNQGGNVRRSSSLCQESEPGLSVSDPRRSRASHTRGRLRCSSSSANRKTTAWGPGDLWHPCQPAKGQPTGPPPCRCVWLPPWATSGRRIVRLCVRCASAGGAWCSGHRGAHCELQTPVGVQHGKHSQ